MYTPTEGDAIQNYSRIFRRPEGVFLEINGIDQIHHDLSVWGTADDIDYIIVTDGEEILGLGDQGCGGILISIAKLVLITLCGGIHPNRVLPVVLDCGTDNKDTLADPLYLGLKERRVRGARYDQFLDTFVTSARKLYPKACIHFEDFGVGNGKGCLCWVGGYMLSAAARRLLEKWRPQIPCLNNDIQGTECVTLASIIAGLYVTKKA
mgnify:CR=1 FL=1